MILSLLRSLEVGCYIVNLKVLSIVICHSSLSTQARQSLSLPSSLDLALSCCPSLLIACSLSCSFSRSFSLSPLSVFLSVCQKHFHPYVSPSSLVFISFSPIFSHLLISLFFLFPGLFLSQRVSEVFSTRFNRHLPWGVSDDDSSKIRVSDLLHERYLRRNPFCFRFLREGLSLSFCFSKIVLPESYWPKDKVSWTSQCMDHRENKRAKGNHTVAFAPPLIDPRVST